MNTGPRYLPNPDASLEITPESVAEWVNLPPDHRPRLIDCREEEELAICQIAGNEWIPLGLFPGLKERLKSGNERGVVVYCHHGMRSLRAATFLRSLGVENAFSMSGGIDHWSRFIDPEVPSY